IISYQKERMTTHVLLIHCPDQKGLLHKISGVLYDFNLNVISNGEFVEKKSSHFFQRTEFSGEFDQAALIDAMQQALPVNVTIKLRDRKKKDVVILATKEHHCLSDLLIRHEFNELNANVMAVISNHQLLEGLVTKFNIPFHHVSTEGIDRIAHENAVLEVIGQYNQ